MLKRIILTICTEILISDNSALAQHYRKYISLSHSALVQHHGNHIIFAQPEGLWGIPNLPLTLLV